MNPGAGAGDLVVANPVRRELEVDEIRGGPGALAPAPAAHACGASRAAPPETDASAIPPATSTFRRRERRLFCASGDMAAEHSRFAEVGHPSQAREEAKTGNSLRQMKRRRQSGSTGAGRFPEYPGSSAAAWARSPFEPRSSPSRRRLRRGRRVVAPRGGPCRRPDRPDARAPLGPGGRCRGDRRRSRRGGWRASFSKGTSRRPIAAGARSTAWTPRSETVSSGATPSRRRGSATSPGFSSFRSPRSGSTRSPRRTKGRPTTCRRTCSSSPKRA